MEREMANSLVAYIGKRRNRQGFGFRSTAEEVTSAIDASGLTVIVTGGASGIGAETAHILALRGAHVIIAARNLTSAQGKKQEICAKKPDARVEVLHLDLSSLASVRKFAEEFNALKIPLNILINNAGVMQCPYQLTEDGIELQFATNHLGHFLLTNLLLDKMKETASQSNIEGRVVIVSSSFHKYSYPEGIRLDKINSPENYTPLCSYGQSKLANLLHCLELSRRLKEEGAHVTVNSLHPGFIFTNLQRHILAMAYVWRIMFFYMWKNVAQGAATSCYVALHPALKGVSGKYFADCEEESPSHPAATDLKLAKELWEVSEKLVTVTASS